MSFNRQAPEYISALSSDNLKDLEQSMKHFTELDGCLNPMPDCDNTVRTMASILYDELDVCGNENLNPSKNFFGLFPACSDELKQNDPSLDYFTRPSRDLPVTEQTDKAAKTLFVFADQYIARVTEYLEWWTEMSRKNSDEIIKGLDATLEQSLHTQYILDQDGMERYNVNYLDDDCDTCGWGPKKLCGFALLYALRPLLLIVTYAMQTYPIDELHLFTPVDVFKGGKMCKSSFGLALVRACAGFLDLDDQYMLQCS